MNDNLLFFLLFEIFLVNADDIAVLHLNIYSSYSCTYYRPYLICCTFLYCFFVMHKLLCVT